MRLQLDGLKTVRALEFDLERRQLVVYHEGHFSEIERALRALGLGSSLLEKTETAKAPLEFMDQRRLLWAVLLINFTFFALEMVTGWLSGSMGLVADSLDMLADALVYGLSLVALGAAAPRKRNVARWSGYFQMMLAVLGFVEVLRRFFGVEALPDFRLMIVVSLLALVANSLCLYLLQRSKGRDVHMQASLIFTSNDVLVNLGVIVAGVLVLWLESGVPDLLVGAGVFILVTLGAVRILRLARSF